MKILNKIIESFTTENDMVAKGLSMYLEEIGLGELISSIKTQSSKDITEAKVEVPVKYFVDKGIKPPYIVRYFDHLVEKGRLDEVVEIGANLQRNDLIHGWLKIGDDERNSMSNERTLKYPTSREVSDLLLELDK